MLNSLTFCPHPPSGRPSDRDVLKTWTSHANTGFFDRDVRITGTSRSPGRIKTRDSAALRSRYLGALPGGPGKEGKAAVGPEGPIVSFGRPGPLKASFQDPGQPKQPAACAAGCLPLCGESEIRTRDTLLGYTRFPGVPLQPLEHLSGSMAEKSGLQIYADFLN